MAAQQVGMPSCPVAVLPAFNALMLRAVHAFSAHPAPAFQTTHCSASPPPLPMQRVSLASMGTSNWLGLRLQLMAAALAAAASGAAVMQHQGLLPGTSAMSAGGDVGRVAGGSVQHRPGMRGWCMHCAGQPRAAWGASESCSNPGSMSLPLLSGSVLRHHHAEHPGWRLCLPSAGLVGLSLAYVLPVTGLLNGLLTSSAETGGLAGRGGGRWHALSCHDQAALALGHL